MDVHVVTYYDNILLVNNLVYHARTKHIEVHYHFVKEKVLTREINLIHFSIKDQVVDIFTKDLGIDELRKFINVFGVLKVDLSLRGSVDNPRSIN
jgi:hypothetical protein